jgi:hypothetical protein
MTMDLRRLEALRLAVWWSTSLPNGIDSEGVLATAEKFHDWIGEIK